jgi:NADH dehydrogenase/NADH:ubiquinone oxidoreductase subunit G
MSEMIEVMIDGQTVSVPAGTTILQAATNLGIEIPTICTHEACTSNALCRLCVVEVQGARTLIPSCVAQVSPGMRVTTRSERIDRSRRTILELLASSVDLTDAPQIQQYLLDYRADADRFVESERREPALIDDNPFFIRDYAKCVLCWRCVQVCAEDAQYTYAINFSGRGYHTQINTFFEKPLQETSCVFCGQCVGVCPTGALKPKRQWLLEQGVPAGEIRSLTRFERRRRRKE